MRYGPNVNYFKLFGSKCYILKESRKGKFDVKGDEDIFLGYSCRSKAYKCLRSGRGGKFISNEFNNFFIENEIKR